MNAVPSCSHLFCTSPSFCTSFVIQKSFEKYCRMMILTSLFILYVGHKIREMKLEMVKRQGLYTILPEIRVVTCAD